MTNRANECRRRIKKCLSWERTLWLRMEEPGRIIVITVTMSPLALSLLSSSPSISCINRSAFIYWGQETSRSLGVREKDVFPKWWIGMIPITNAEINLDKEFSSQAIKKWIEKWSNDRNPDVRALGKKYKFKCLIIHFQKLIQNFFLWS